MSRFFILSFLLIWLSVHLSGCTFNRTVVNGHVQRLDTSFIHVGSTTFDDVMAHLGPPSTLVGEGKRVEALQSQRLRYVCHEKKSVSLDLGGGYMISLGWTWGWDDEQPIYECAIDFDENGVVTRVAKTRRGTLWKPLAAERFRSPLSYQEWL